MTNYDEAIPTLGHRDREFRSIFSGLIPITIGVIVLISVTYFLLDRQHMSRVEACQNALFVYPGATILSRVDEPLTQPFGIIETRMEMTSPDDPNTVQSWYSRTWGLYVRAQIQHRDRNSNVPVSVPPRGWDIESAPEGTRIHLTGLCP